MKKNGPIFLAAIALLATFCSVCFGQDSQETNSLPWHKWHPQVESYIDKTINLFADIGDIISAHIGKVDQQTLPATKKELFFETSRNISVIGEKINLLNPPLDLTEYHEKVYGAWNYVNNFYTDQRERNNEELKEMGREYLLSQIEIIKEIKKLFIKHGAPADYVANQDAVIEHLRNQLKKY